MTRETLVEASGLGTRFGRHTWVHRGLDLTVERGDVLALVGGSGSGKTTLLRHINGLTRPSEGSVAVFGQPLFSGDRFADRSLRRRFGMLFQHGALFSALDVFQNIAFPLRELRVFDDGMIRELVYLKLAQVELKPADAGLMPAQLSGGMVRRVGLARALALEPELLLLDEPTAGLDPDRSEAFVRLIRQLRAELGLTVVLVTHDLDTLAALASRVAVLAERRILVSGPLEQIMQTDHPFVRGFFGSERSRVALERGRALE